MNLNEDVIRVFEELERCHTAMGDFFPHIGLLEVGGSKALLSMRIMPVLQNCAFRVQESLSNWMNCPPDLEIEKQQMIELWSSVADLLERLIKTGNRHDAVEINEAATLLYLVSGASWNYWQELLSVEPPHNLQYLRVEPTIQLLKHCGREYEDKANTDPKLLIKRLHVELKTCIR